MISNFHTHTFRCHHAKGSERDYVIAAINAGIKYLGFSDHSPYYFPDGYYSHFRMSPDEVTEYVGEIIKLREEFKDHIKIYIGYEAEYYPEYFEKTFEIWDRAPYDYLIMGQHFIGNEIGEQHSAKPTEDTRVLDRYVEQVIEGMRTGRFFYIAHPDVLNITCDGDCYEEKMTLLCKEAKKLDIPLEINMLGLRERRSYPDARFWKIAGKIGNTAILGCDAHDPSHIAVPENVDEALRWADRFGVEVIEPTEPIKIRF